MSDFYIGQILNFAGNFAIQGTARCDGQLVAISQNTALFSIIGTIYGGDGVNTFALPDLRGRRIVHQGQGPGLSSYVVGQVAGVENVTLNSVHLPSHTHAVTGTLPASGLQPHATSVSATNGALLGHAVDISGNTPKALPAIYCPAGTTANVALDGLTVTMNTAGSSLPISIINPTLAITMLIYLNGIFPTRN